MKAARRVGPLTEPDPDRLTELVNDERARRAYAEKELAQQRAETGRWRRRARSAEAAAKLSIRIPRVRRPGMTKVAPPRPARIVFPSIRAGVAGVPLWLPKAVDTVDLDGIDEAGLTGVDLVAVGGREVPPGLTEWLALPTRQPLIAFAPTGELARVLEAATPELVVGRSSLPARRRLEEVSPLETREPDQPMDREQVRGRIVGARGKTLREVTAAILEAAGIDPPEKNLTVTAIVMTKRPHRVAALLETLERMDVEGMEVSLATHGFEVTAEERKVAEAHFGSRVRFSVMSESSPLGRCLNEMVESTTTEAWAKIDDDDHYGPLYLEEALLELERTGVDMVGKLTHHLYDSRPDKTYLLETGNEYRHTRYVPGPTFVARRKTWEEVRFPHRHARVDSIFVRGMNALGMSIYSTSRFEFAYGRGDDDHTWHVDESLYAAKGREVGDGFARDAIFLEPAPLD